MKHFLIFGTHPALSLAEAEAVLGHAPVTVAGEQLAVYDETAAWDGAALQSRLAGIIKLGEILFEMPLAKISLDAIAEWCLTRHQGGKILFGFTVYGGSDTQRMRIEKCALPFKRLLQASEFPVRWVTGKEGSLSPAAVDKLNLTQEGYDFVFGIVGQTVYIGRTTHVQDATAWSTRDYGRPFRDARTGMLPPKLARLMVNLGCKGKNLHEVTLLDPFCGGGTVLMEAALLGVKNLIGSDIDGRQVAGSTENMDWMVAQRMITQQTREQVKLFTVPAQKIREHLKDATVNVIVSEGYLGNPLQGNEPLTFLNRQKQEIEQLWHESLKACAPLQSAGDLAICIWPSYVTQTSTVSIDLSARLAEVGYKKINTTSLVYGRAEQHVKRQVVILERITT